MRFDYRPRNPAPDVSPGGTDIWGRLSGKIMSITLTLFPPSVTLVQTKEYVNVLAVPGKVLSITGNDPLTRAGKVNFGGIMKDVNFAYVPEVKVGDYVIVHVVLP